MNMADTNAMERAGHPRSGSAAPRLNSEILDRLPPQSLEAERAVLGSLLLDPQLCDEVALLLRAEDFYADANQRLYRHLFSLHDEGKRVDITLLVERLRQSGEYEAIGGGAYIAEVAQSVPYAHNAPHYAEIVRNKASVRELIHAATEILRDAWDAGYEPRELLSQAEERIFGVHDRRSNDRITHIQDLLIEAFDRIDARAGGAGGDAIPTHFRDLDELTGGLHPSEFVVLAARPSMGKTALATNIAENVAIESRVPVLFVSLEMSRLELAQRLLCSQGSIDGRKFRNGFISSAEREKLIEASGKLSQSPLFIDDTPSRTVTEIAACARRLKRKEKLGLVVVDYLQLIQPDDPRDPRQEQVAKMARRLKALARELQIPIMVLAQLNRQVEASGREEHRPRLSHLRESGAIEQDADVVMFVHREEYYHTKEKAEELGITGQGLLVLAKQRNGPTGDVKLQWSSAFTRFRDFAEKPYEEFSSYGADF
jgi:replicative DNA helicase